MRVTAPPSHLSDDELTRRAIEWLCEQRDKYSAAQLRYTPTDIVREIGGYPPSIGRVAPGIVNELQNRGIFAKYEKVNNKAHLVLFKKSTDNTKN